MFARISFDDNQRATNEKLKEIENFLSDEIDFEKLCVKVNSDDPDEKPFEFYSWNHTFNPLDLEKEDNKKALVREVDLVKIKTSKEYLTNLEEFLSKFPSVKIKVRGIQQGFSEVNMFTTVIDEMKMMQSKFEKALSAFDKSIEFNQKCDVHVAGLGLLNINQLGFAVDKCTEELQTIMNKGWRIIACCVQPDQRRPDYILGRYNPEETSVDCVNF